MALFKPFPQRDSFCVLSMSTVLRASTQVVVLMGAFAGCAGAAADERAQLRHQTQSYVVDVPVVRARAVEVTRTVERPEKTCERVRHYDSRDSRDSRRDRRRGSGGVGARILGGLVGGAIGNQFGGGSGKKALTIAGALLGSSIAGSRQEHDRYSTRRRSDRDWDERNFQPEYQCRTTTGRRQVTHIDGYDVTYLYNNNLYKRRMDYDPGDTLELRVRAVPDVAPTVADS